MIITDFVSHQPVIQESGKSVVVCRIHTAVSDGSFNYINLMKIANICRTYKLLRKFIRKVRKNPTEKSVMQYVNKIKC